MCHFRTLVLAGLAASALPLCALADQATDAFDSLYGKDMKAVAATRDTADDLALAGKLLDAAGDTETHPALAVVLCDNAYDLAAKDPKGTATAVRAMELAGRKTPEKKPAFLARAVAVCRRRYDTASSVNRTSAGNLLVGMLLKLGDAQVEVRDIEAAEKTCRHALAVANAIKTPLASSVQERMDGLAQRSKTLARIKTLKAALDADPANASARSALVRLHTVELDDPAEAAKYLGDDTDASFKKYVVGAAKGVRKAPELACMELGEWYRGLASESSPGAGKAMLKRAQAYYKRFLKLHEKDDLSRSQAVLALNKVNDALAGPVPAADAAGAGASAKGKKLPNGKWIDILRLIDPAKDCTDRKGLALWKRRGNTLVATPTQYGRTNLFAPVSVDGSYDLQVKFARNQIYGYTYVYLPVGSSTVALQLGSGVSGLAYVRGSSPYSNATGASVTFLVKRIYTIDVKVAIDGDQAAIAVNLDGKPLIRWKGPQEDLSSTSYTTRHKDRVGFATYDVGVTLGAARLRMQSGAATALRR